MILFEHIETQKKILVGNLHLKSKPPNQRIRIREITEYFLKLGELCNEIEEQDFVPKGEAKNIPLIIAGDFNDEPESPVITDVVYDTDMTGGFKLDCAYKIDGKYPEYTTYKYRHKDKLIRHTIDYIFYNEHLKLKSIREMPKEEDIPEMGIPSYRCSSDHFPSAATFEF